MSRVKDHKVKKCGCVYFDVGDPVLCVKHLKKEEKRAAKMKKAEEKGLRKAAADAAERGGHVLTRFQEYGASGQPGKWTAYCRKCGDIVIVYDEIDQAPGDQVTGKPLQETCRRIDTVIEEDEDGNEQSDSEDLGGLDGAGRSVGQGA